MQKGLKVSKAGIAGIIILLGLLILVRLFEDKLFYDPLLSFFSSDEKILPQYDGLKLFSGLALRYLLNSLLSLGIIYLFFKDSAILKLASILYCIFFVLLSIAFFIVIGSDDPNLLLLFYLRRFLIQPLFLILFVPAFYYQKKMR